MLECVASQRDIALGNTRKRENVFERVREASPPVGVLSSTAAPTDIGASLGVANSPAGQRGAVPIRSVSDMKEKDHDLRNGAWEES